MDSIRFLSIFLVCIPLVYGQIGDNCAGIQCSPPNCVNTYIPLGGCCPTCGGPGASCTYRDKTYLDEETFKDDCNTCSCKNGEVACTQLFCPNDKAGSCPRPTGPGVCVERCLVDADCPRRQKCCSNGCGHTCMRPQKGKPCTHMGRKYRHGATFMDDCNTCSCNNGAASCTAMSCPSKPGTCPAPTGVGICVDECNDDMSCPGDQKCCSNGCGKTCRSPSGGGGSKPGTCPVITVGRVGICVDECADDYGCSGDQKCCSDGCGKVCMSVSGGGGKPGTCPAVQPGMGGICVEDCVDDFGCPGDQKCCSNGCGKVCMTPSGGGVIKPGTCPAPPPVMPGICVDNCADDSGCPGDQKCCSNGCGKVCVSPSGGGGSKPGTCPVPRSGMAGICVDECTDDFSCLGNKPCIHNGVSYPDGETFMDDCNTCRCRNGVAGCTRMACQSKPGTCPAPQSGMAGICVDECTNDFSCLGDQKCCSNGCGKVCMSPSGGGGSKPGTCPAIQPGVTGICVDECTDDYSCLGDQKCCSNGCGKVCMSPSGGGGKPCIHNGVSYPDGESFMDDCNTCRCRNGAAACTRMGCPKKPCIHNGVSYPDGETFMDDCNTCRCRNGAAACTRMGCPKKPCIHNGVSYPDGETFMDDCNTCRCSNGAAACTRMGCPKKPCIHNGVSYPDGETFMDDCNTCRCSNGVAGCTRMACPKRDCIHNGVSYPEGSTFMDDCNTCTCSGGKAACTLMACPKVPCFHNGVNYNDGATFKEDCNTCICSDGNVECTMMTCPDVKPGSCPPPIGVGVCVQRCTTDLSCPGREKCCSTGCGSLCLPPRNGGLSCTHNGATYNDGETFMDDCNTCICNDGTAACTKIACPDTKPGTCPAPSGVGVCIEGCTSDRDCSRREKCCSNGCGHICMLPESAGKPCMHNGMPYKDGQSFKDSCNTCECTNGVVGCTNMACPGMPCVYKGQTYNHGVTFKDACNTCNCNDGIAQCTRMSCPNEKPGECPAYSGVGLCIHRCTTDASCQGDQKCCSNGCGTECMLPSSGGLPCMHNGISYRDGETFMDDCNTCTCSNGKSACTRMACPHTPCLYNGKTYNHGETFKDDCNTCSCNDGRAACTRMACPEQKPGKCPPVTGVGICVDRCTTDLSCPGVEKCCSNGCGKDCTSPFIGKPCYHNGIEYPDGQSFMDNCNTCTCENGIAACTKMSCVGKCVYKGRSYSEGESFNDDCNTCSCAGGQVTCTLMACPGTKPGTCPIVSGGAGICVEDCTTDSTCPGIQKCCSNGCGHVCMRPDYGGHHCLHNGLNYTDGETFKDDCNTCTCQDGKVGCTKRACPPKRPCYHDGIRRNDGEKFMNDCNTCICTNGRILCTFKACGKPCVHKGVTYQDGENFKDDCNTCACRNGNVGCTLLQCADEKPGTCPRPSLFGVCNNRCARDRDCFGKQKCCTNWCGKMCMDPVGVDVCIDVVCPPIECPRGHEKYTPPGQCCQVCRPPAGEKPGRCPRPSRVEACVDMCTSDYSCPGQQKCCKNRCGSSCMRPTRYDRCYGVSCPPLRCLRQFRPPGRCCPVCRRGQGGRGDGRGDGRENGRGGGRFKAKAIKK